MYTNVVAVCCSLASKELPLWLLPPLYNRVDKTLTLGEAQRYPRSFGICTVLGQ